MTIITHQGTAQEKKITKSVLFDKEQEQTIRITLEDGRREQRRTTFRIAPQEAAREWERAASLIAQPAPRRPDRAIRQVAAEFRNSRQGSLPSRTQPGGNPGGVGLRPS